MEFNELIGQFAREAGIADAAADETGVFHFAIDDMTVSFEADEASEKLATSARVGELPSEGRERLYRLMLKAMFRGEGTDGALLSIAHDSDAIFLHRIDSLAVLDLERFKAMLERFVNALEEWRKLLADFRAVIPAIERATTEEEEKRRELDNGEFLRV